jgi:hypothetical protein
LVVVPSYDDFGFHLYSILASIFLFLSVRVCVCVCVCVKDKKKNLSLVSLHPYVQCS